jgi:hypothetical protein
MNYYPYINPIILTDPIFFDYGGHRGSSSPEQRQAAYWIAERTASEDINTYLLPTIVTGSYIYNPLRDIILEHGYINQIIETRFIDKEENIYFTVSGINNVYVGLKDDERGVVVVVSNWFNLGELYKNQIIYNAGLHHSDPIFFWD